SPSQTHERYGVEHTFFGGRVYVVSSAPDLHQFLRRTLAEDQPASESDLPAHRRAEQRRAFALIRHALLHRGRMHPYDIGRQLELSYDSGERDRLEANPGLLLRNRSTRYEALFQLCIEWVLAEGSQQREGSSDPYYVQIAYDALYQVSDRWKDGQSLRDPPAIEAAWIQQRTSEPHQRTLLRGALDQLMHYLAEPSRLTAEVTDELDGTRLTLFLREGEADPETGDVDAIIDELGDDQLRGRNPRLVAAALATAKFDLLRALADTLDPVFGPDSYAPLIDPRGYGRVDPLISEEEQRRIDRLQAIRQFDQVTAVGFDALWGLASRGGTIDVLDAALAPNTPLVPGDGRASNRDVLRQFAAEAPEAERIVFAALVCVHVMAAITETEPCTDHVQTLGRIVRGVGAHARFEFVATLATKLLRLHGATPSAQTRRLLTWERGTLPLPNAEDLEAALDIPDLARDLGTARAEWELSICERMLIRLAQRQLDAEVNREGQFLDLVAGLHHWFPRALEVWRQFPEPSQWTIKIWSDVLDDPDTMTVVRGFAALQLGMVSRLRDLLASDQTESSPSQWLQRRLDELGKEPRPVVILVNPGVVMSEWNPVPGLSVRVLEVEALDETTVPDIRHAAAVFHEYGTPVKQQGKGNRQAVRPESLQPSQYAIVRPGTADGRWDTLADGTPILHAPPSLRAALELHRRVFPR
ncbi:MAG: hypothetical protein K0V04_38970, partial [Deltaproteobacteria bacterium]|nr:hypothetical protein [Deltaproteobacteria bacterium]